MTAPRDLTVSPTSPVALPPGFDSPPDVSDAIHSRLQVKPGKIIATLLVLLIAAWVVYQLIGNKGFEWGVVSDYLFSSLVLKGLWITILLTALTMVLACLLGVPIAVMRLSHNAVMVSTAGVFVWFFRGTPALVQLVFWFNLAVLFPKLSIGIPFGGPTFIEGSTNVIVTPFLAALLGLGLNEAAYMAEIIRGGILSVDRGQQDAARAVGMGSSRMMRRVILPQAMRSIIPATGNQTIGMLKFTSLASVVALGELLHSVQNIYARTFQTIPLLIVASLWYLVLTTVLSLAQGRIEHHYLRGERQAAYSMWTGLSSVYRSAAGRRSRHAVD